MIVRHLILTVPKKGTIMLITTHLVVGTRWSRTPRRHGTTWQQLELDMGVSQNLGCHFGGPYNKDYSILGSILGPRD